MIHGYALAYTIAQALSAAGEDPTRESLLAAMDEGGFTGPALTPYAWSADDHAGMTGIRVMQIDDLVAKPVSPVYVTDAADGPVEEYDTPQPEAPANGVPE